jgi:hypothetical protein
MINLLIEIGIISFVLIIIVLTVLKFLKNRTFLGLLKVFFLIFLFSFILLFGYYCFYIPGIDMGLYKTCIILLFLTFLTLFLIIILTIINYKKK